MIKNVILQRKIKKQKMHVNISNHPKIIRRTWWCPRESKPIWMMGNSN